MTHETAEITILPQDIEWVASEGRKVWRTDNQGGDWTLTRADLDALTAEHPDAWADADNWELTSEGATLIADDLNERKPWIS